MEPLLIARRMHRWLLAGLLAWAAGSAAATQQAEVIAHMLDYVAVDYAVAVQDGQVISEAEFKEMQDFTTQIVDQLAQLPAKPRQAILLEQARALATRVNDKAAPAEIADRAGNLRRGLITAYELVVAPRAAPDLELAATRYQALCASCHGATGRGDGPAATPDMDPPPSDFHDEERMRARSVYGLYNTITLGVGGTSMQSYAQALSEEERWALALYVSSLRADAALIAQGEALWESGAGKQVFGGLRDVTSLSVNEAVERGGPDMAAVLAYLVRKPQAVAGAKGSPIATTRAVMAQSLAAYAQGDRDAAQRLAVSAYLEGFELAEASLDTLDAQLRLAVEDEMIALRGLMREGAPAEQVQAQAQSIYALLDRAEELLSGEGLSPGAAAFSAFVILLREGLEAILVLAAVFAFLVKAERRDAMCWVHVGWIAALALGLLTWFAASYLIEVSGAGRELTEAITALTAAAVLLYVGFWLHSKAYAQAWQRYVREKLSGALSRGTLWALAAVSFLAVYREVFETVLFYQALWTQAGEGGAGAVVGGFLAAAFALAVVSWLVFRFGVRLPIGPFFAASSVLLAALAVVFVGKGVAALQEAGYLAIDVVAFPRIPSLGVYPTGQSLTAQAVVVALVLLGFAWAYLGARRMRRAA